jgi:hypothetical protein
LAHLGTERAIFIPLETHMANLVFLNLEQEARFDEILVQWQAAVDAKHAASGFTYPSDKVHYHIGGKYARFDIGGSGAFTVEMETGTVYGVKAYGHVNKAKNSGNIYDPGFNGAVLVRDRSRYGQFVNNSDGSVRK